MDECGGGNEGIAVGARVGYVERRATLCYRSVNRQDATQECGNYVLIHPGTKHRTLLLIATFKQKDSYL